MIRRARLVLLALAAVAACSFLPPSPEQPRVPTTWSAPVPDGSAPAALPEGFAATVDSTTSSRFVRVVADDIDRDGDLDVVASVGTLDLLVWENDGAGHFSRRHSSSHEEMRAQPPAPTVDGDGVPSNRWIQREQERGAHPGATAARADAGPGRAFAAIARASTGQHGPRLRSSRAPPIA